MSKRNWLIFGIGSIFAGLVCFSLLTVEPIRVTNSRLTRWRGRVFVEGQVRNTDSVARSVDLEVHYFNEDGHPLGQNAVSIGSLKPGQSKTFRTPLSKDDGVKDFSIYLNHGRNPYGN